MTASHRRPLSTSPRPLALACYLGFTSAMLIPALYGTAVQAQSVATPSSGGDQSMMPTVTVVGDGVDLERSLSVPAASGALGTRSVLDTPFSITSVSQSEIEERLATNIEQVFRYDASTTMTGVEYGQSPSISVRGLGIDGTNGLKVDGLAIAGWSNDLPLEFFERVDLLKGLSGFMYGFGSPGGILNYVVKRPTDETQFNASLGYKSDSLFSQSIDMGGRAGRDDRFGYRVNLFREEGDTYIDDGSLRREGASLALDARLTDDVTLTFDALYANRKSRNNSFWGYDIGDIQAIPGTVNPRIASQPEGAYFDTKDRVVTTGLQWRMAPGWKTSVTYRNARKDLDYNNSTLYVSNLVGDYTADQSLYRFAQEYKQWQALVEGEASTGPIGHKLTFGASRQSFGTLSDRESTYTANIGSGNIYRGTTLTAYGDAGGHSLYKTSAIVQDALFVSDTLSFGEHWSVIGGIRYNRFDQSAYNLAGARTTRYERNPLTPTVALIYKPTQNDTLYASYVEALERGGTAGVNTINFGEVMSPIKSKQYEAGYKYEAPTWATTAALFRMDRTAEYTNDDNRFVQDGITRYQGVDLNGTYDINRDLSLSGGVMYLNSTYVESSAGLEGKRTTGTPHLQAATRLSYQLPVMPAVSVSLGAKYVGSSQMNTANTYSVPSYTVFDAGAQYRARILDRDVTLTAQIQNLANRRYWTYNGSNYIAPGAPRTVSLNARMAF